MEEDLTLKVGTSGADEAANKIKAVKDRLSDTGKETSTFSDKLQKASLAIGAIGVGLTAYSKSATDSSIQYVKSVQSIAKVTGDSVEQTSRLQYVFQRSGIAADQAASVFGVFSKQIVASNEATKDGALKQADLANKIQAAKIKVADLTAEQTKNGDKSGELKNKIEALNISISGYQKSMSDAVTPLQKLGVATQDATGKSRSFNDILLDVADKFKTMPNGAEKTATAMQLFGRSGKDLIGILSKGSDGIKELEEQSDKLGLTLTTKNVEAVAKYTEAQKKLKDSQQQLTLAVGMQALPMWQKLADVQVAVASSFGKLPKPMQQVVGGFLAFGGPVLSGTAAVAGFGSSLTDISGKSMPAMLKQIPFLGNAVSKLAGSFGALGGLLANPIVLAVAAVVVAIGFLLVKFNQIQPLVDGIKNAFNTMWPILQQYLAPAIASIQSAFTSMGTSLQPLMPYLQILAVFIRDVLIAAFVGLVATISIVIVILANVIAAFVQFYAGVAAIVIAGFAVLKNIFTGNWGALNASIQNFINVAFAQLGRIVNIGGLFQNALAGVYNIVMSYINQILGGIGNFVGTFSNSGKALIEAFGNGISSAMGKVKDKVKSGLSDIRRLLPFSDAKEGPLSTLTLSGRRFAETFARGIDKGAGAIQNAATGALSGLGSGTLSQGTAGTNGSVSAVPSGSGAGGVTNQFLGNFSFSSEQAVDRFYERFVDTQRIASIGAPV